MVPGIRANTDLWLPSLSTFIFYGKSSKSLLNVAIFDLVEEYLASCSAVFLALFLIARLAPGTVIRRVITSALPLQMSSEAPSHQLCLYIMYEIFLVG